MKTTAKVAVFVMAILLTILIQMALTSSNARASENENALTAAVEQSLAQLKAEKGYAIDSYEEWIADFSQRLLLQVNSDSDLKVEVLAADLKKGILDIRVTESYRTVKGNTKEAKCRKTVFLEQHDDTHQKGYRTIRFLSEGTLFCQYSIYEGSVLTDPGTPELAGRVFRHWKLSGTDGAAEIGNMTASGNMTFTAVYE